MSLGECFTCKDPVCEHVMKMLDVREARIIKAEKQLEAAEAYIEGEEYWAGPGDWKNALEVWRKASGKSK